MAPDRLDLTDEVISGLTDAELVEHHRSLAAKEARTLIKSEIDVRLAGMIRAARLAFEPTRQYAQWFAGVYATTIKGIEQGWFRSNRPGLFERACTEGGLDLGDRAFRNTPWYPLADPLFCRTIRDVEVEPDWLSSQGGTVADLARSIRDDRAFHLLPILGDALEEAGCVDLAILSHCRNPGEHAIGCWVTDALIRAGRGSSRRP